MCSTFGSKQTATITIRGADKVSGNNNNGYYNIGDAFDRDVEMYNIRVQRMYWSAPTNTTYDSAVVEILSTFAFVDGYDTNPTKHSMGFFLMSTTAEDASDVVGPWRTIQNPSNSNVNVRLNDPANDLVIEDDASADISEIVITFELQAL